jgi:hypothetical protein
VRPSASVAATPWGAFCGQGPVKRPALLPVLLASNTAAQLPLIVSFGAMVKAAWLKLLGRYAKARAFPGGAVQAPLPSQKPAPLPVAQGLPAAGVMVQPPSPAQAEVSSQGPGVQVYAVPAQPPSAVQTSEWVQASWSSHPCPGAGR